MAEKGWKVIDSMVLLGQRRKGLFGLEDYVTGKRFILLHERSGEVKAEDVILPDTEVEE